VRERVLRQLRAQRERHDLELRRLLARAVETGIPTHDIAQALGISRATLWRRYGDVVRRGVTRDRTGPS